MTEKNKALEQMSFEELKEQKRLWYVAAVGDGSLNKCAVVCCELGENLNDRYGPKHRFVMGDLELYVDGYGGYATATYRGQSVMSTHTCSKLFIPGKWMERVEAAYPGALSQRGKQESLRQEDDRQALLNELTLKGD
ncbi:hypothetical protein ES708_22235 [subsurface metagenome]